jgi:hypothetical protein
VVHACVETMVGMVNVTEHFLSASAISGCEGLVPLREYEGLGVGRRMLSQKGPSAHELITEITQDDDNVQRSPRGVLSQSRGRSGPDLGR